MSCSIIQVRGKSNAPIKPLQPQRHPHIHPDSYRLQGSCVKVYLWTPKGEIWYGFFIKFWTGFLMGVWPSISEITRISEVILKTWENGDFTELLISRKLLEIEPNRVNFWMLCFFEVFASKIQFFRLKKNCFSNSAL